MPVEKGGGNVHRGNCPGEDVREECLRGEMSYTRQNGGYDILININPSIRSNFVSVLFMLLTMLSYKTKCYKILTVGQVHFNGKCEKLTYGVNWG